MYNTWKCSYPSYRIFSITMPCLVFPIICKGWCLLIITWKLTNCIPVHIPRTWELWFRQRVREGRKCSHMKGKCDCVLLSGIFFIGIFNRAGFWSAMASNWTNQSRNVLSKKLMVNTEVMWSANTSQSFLICFVVGSYFFAEYEKHFLTSHFIFFNKQKITDIFFLSGIYGQHNALLNNNCYVLLDISTCNFVNGGC